METLKELLFVENQTVTVKSLSRALLLDVPSCKELIRQSSELPDVVPIYLVKKIQDGSIFVSLMDHQEYTAIKDKSNITSYVYAVSTGIVADLANLALVNQEAGKLDSIDSVRKLRSTINSSVVVAKKRAYSAPAPVQPSRIAAAKPVQKNQPAKERKSATKGSTFFGSKSKTSAAPATIITTTTPMEDSETTKSLKNKDVEKEEIITRKAKPAIKTTAKSKAQAKEIAGLFDDALTTKRTISVESDEGQLSII